MISSLIDFAVILGIFLAFLLVSGHFPGLVALGVFPILVVLIAFSVGLGIFLGTINVFYRDVEKSVSIVLQFWFWLTPIVYIPKTLPSVMKALLAMNPIWPIIDAMHRIFSDGQLPQWETLLFPAVLSVIMVFLGMFAFWRLQGEIVDEL